MKKKAYKDNVVIEMDMPEQQTQSGIILTNTKKKSKTGKVLSSNVPELKEGDKIIFKEHSSWESGEKGKVIVNIKDIVAIF